MTATRITRQTITGRREAVCAHSRLFERNPLVGCTSLGSTGRIVDYTVWPDTALLRVCRAILNGGANSPPIVDAGPKTSRDAQHVVMRRQQKEEMGLNDCKPGVQGKWDDALAFGRVLTAGPRRVTRSCSEVKLGSDFKSALPAVAENLGLYGCIVPKPCVCALARGVAA